MTQSRDLGREWRRVCALTGALLVYAATIAALEAAVNQAPCPLYDD